MNLFFQGITRFIQRTIFGLGGSRKNSVPLWLCQRWHIEKWNRQSACSERVEGSGTVANNQASTFVEFCQWEGAKNILIIDLNSLKNYSSFLPAQFLTFSTSFSISSFWPCFSPMFRDILQLQRIYWSPAFFYSSFSLW